jgi:acetoin utilization deacetylase AcuC-like enzyme
VADELGVPVVLVLEGGYDVDALARSLVAVLAVLGAPEARPADEDLLRHPLASAALGRLASRWPSLAR